MVSVASSLDSVVNVIQSEHGKLRQQQRRISSVDLKEAMKRGIQSKTMTPYGPNKGGMWWDVKEKFRLLSEMFFLNL